MKTIKLKPKQTCVVISDLHIGNGNKLVLNRVLPILESADFVIFNGDIFELYVHDFSKLIKKEAYPLTKWMFDNPNKFVFIVGNHDDKLWDLQDFIFWDLHSSVTVSQGKNKFVITHGHQFDEKNRITTTLGKLIYRIEYYCNKIFGVIWQDLIFRRKKYFYRFANWLRQKRLPKVRHNARIFCSSTGTKSLIHGHTHFKNVDYFNGGQVIDQGGFVVGETYVIIKSGYATLTDG